MEYLHEGSPDCPLVRLFDFEPDDIARLIAVCHRLASGEIDAFALDDKAWVKSIGGCGLA